MKREAPAANRNTEPICAVLERVLPAAGLMLEIACGTGQHALAFSKAFPSLQWQPSDCDPEALASTAVWRAEEGPANLLAPILLDVAREPWPIVRADSMLCINMIHISPWESALALLAGAGRLLPNGGRLILYGPYIVPGVETAASNLYFDQSLRMRDDRWGVRNLQDVERAAKSHGLDLVETVTMPANNLCVVFERQP